MPLYRSARLFTLGLALAGTCAARSTEDTKHTFRPKRQTLKGLPVKVERKPGGVKPNNAKVA